MTFEIFENKDVKVVYDDGNNPKTARGVLKILDNGFISVSGSLGTMIIRENKIIKMGFNYK